MMTTTAYSIAFFLTGLLALVLLLNYRRAGLNVLKTFVLLGLYLGLVVSLYRLPEWKLSWAAHLLSGMTVPLAVTILAAICFAAVAYAVDCCLDRAPRDDFKADQLFFRYGRQLYYEAIPIGMEEGIGPEDAAGLRERLDDFLREQLQERFGNLTGTALRRISIKDLSHRPKPGQPESQREKAFLALALDGPQQTKLHYFLHLEGMPQHLIVHIYGYFAGRHAWHQALFFIAAAPFHLWRWVLPWVLGRHHTPSRLNRRFKPKSYVLMELRSRSEAAHLAIFAALRRFAQVYGLLSEEVDALLKSRISGASSFFERKSSGRFALFG
jgi:hypothetical protein